jgi:hypothetical protein
LRAENKHDTPDPNGKLQVGHSFFPLVDCGFKLGSGDVGHGFAFQPVELLSIVRNCAKPLSGIADVAHRLTTLSYVEGGTSPFECSILGAWQFSCHQLLSPLLFPMPMA